MAFKSVWGFNPEELLRAHSMSFLLGTPVARVLGRAHQSYWRHRRQLGSYSYPGYGLGQLALFGLS